MSEHESFQKQFIFFRNHFFFKIEWIRFRFFFKKLFLFQVSIRALNMQHHIKKRIIILNDRIKKIAQFSTFENKIEIRTFLKTIEIIKKWISNFFEISKFLIKFINKANWNRIEFETLSFEIFKIKCATVSSVFEYDYSLSTHFYTNASKYICELIIIQFQFQKKKMIEISVQYDFIIFISTEMRYSIYKRKLCVLTKFVIKYDHFCKHSRIMIVVHIDHKFLIQFLKSDDHENIYEHWTNKLRRLNLKIQYISKRRNRVTDELFRILFLAKNCTVDQKMIETWRVISKKNSIWIWKNDKKDYQIFLNFFNDSNKMKIISNEILHEKNVFFLSMKINVDSNRNFWKKTYLISKWFADIYRAHTTDQSFSLSDIFFKIMNFRINFHIKIL